MSIRNFWGLSDWLIYIWTAKTKWPTCVCFCHSLIVNSYKSSQLVYTPVSMLLSFNHMEKLQTPTFFPKSTSCPPSPPPIQHFQILLHSHRTMLDFFIFIVYIHFIHFYFQDWKYLRGMYILIDIQSVYDWLILNFWSFNFKSFKFSLCALKAKKSESFWHL